MHNQPIGVFDSGYGGLTVLRELHASLPGYDFIYLGDNARAPYGPKDFETVYEYSLQAVKWLFDKGCSLVILACNTASAKALRTIQQEDLPQIGEEKRVLGVIRPTAEIIGNYSHSGHVGILGTQGTINSDSYRIETNKFFPEVKLTQQVCKEWVDLVEKNKTGTEEAEQIVQADLQTLISKDNEIDTILLGCTHYPLLLPVISKFIHKDIKVVTQGKIVAESLKHYLQRHPDMDKRITKERILEFYSTGNVGDFEAHASLFFGKEITAKFTIL